MKFQLMRRPDPVIDVTPMIDVVFQLLLFFMVTTSFISNPGIDVDLPRSSADALITENKDLNIWMTEEGAVYADEQPVTAESLRKLFIRRAKEDTSVTVVIKADQGVSHGRVVGIMDLARTAGLTNLAIATSVSKDK